MGTVPSGLLEGMQWGQEGAGRRQLGPSPGARPSPTWERRWVSRQGWGRGGGPSGEGHQAPGKSSQNKCLENKFLPFLASTFHRNAARPERQQHPLLPAPEKEGWGVCMPVGVRNGLSNSCFTLQALGDILQSPPKGLEPSP